MVLAAVRKPVITSFHAGISIICQGSNPWRGLRNTIRMNTTAMGRIETCARRKGT